MHMEENHHLLQPLIHSSTTSDAAASAAQDDHDRSNLKLDVQSNSGIIFRLTFVAFIGIISIWANHESSKGFALAIVNDAGNTSAGERFQLFYMSNDEATRILIRASKLVEDFLYRHEQSQAKKQVRSIILKLANRKLDNQVVVVSESNLEFVISISPSIMEGTNFDDAMFLAVKQGVARIWLWDGQGNAPRHLINGIVEYITSYIGGSVQKSNVSAAESPRLATATACWKHDNPSVVAGFLDYCEHQRSGFIRRLNQAMKDGWHDGKLDVALGLPVQNLCTTYESSRYKFFQRVAST